MLGGGRDVDDGRSLAGRHRHVDVHRGGLDDAGLAVSRQDPQQALQQVRLRRGRWRVRGIAAVRPVDACTLRPDLEAVGQRRD